MNRRGRGRQSIRLATISTTFSASVIQRAPARNNDIDIEIFVLYHRVVAGHYRYRNRILDPSLGTRFCSSSGASPSRLASYEHLPLSACSWVYHISLYWSAQLHFYVSLPPSLLFSQPSQAQLLSLAGVHVPLGLELQLPGMMQQAGGVGGAAGGGGGMPSVSALLLQVGQRGGTAADAYAVQQSRLPDAR